MRSSISINKTFVPINSDFNQKRIEEVKTKVDILGKATIAGRKNEPHSTDRDLDENQRSLIGETQGFVGGVTRIAGAEITERTNAARALTPSPLDTALESSGIHRQVV